MKKEFGNQKSIKRKRRTKTPAKTLAPFLNHLREFDDIKVQLLDGHFYKSKLTKLQNLLNKTFAKLKVSIEKETLNLKNPGLIKDWLFDEVGHEYVLDIRYKNNFPSYLLVKVIRDYWLNTIFIQEIIYKSPDYPIIDDRMVSLLIWGNEKSAVRLDHIKSEISIKQQKLLGLILTAAWTQKEYFLVYYFFPKTSSFRQLIELTSLVKNTQTATLRDIAKESISFFKPTGCHPHKILVDWFDFLNNATGNDIDEKEKEVRIVYYKIKSAWKNMFLNIPATLSKNHPEQPVWKWSYANYWRLNTNLLKEDITQQEAVQRGMDQLEAIAEEQIRDLFATKLSSFLPTL